MGKRSRSKGYRGEYELVCLLRREGITALRVPLSGSTDFQKGDVIVAGGVGEVKLRRNGFKEIYKWLNDRDWLFLKADRCPYLVVMQLDKFIKLVKGERRNVQVHQG